MQNWRSINSVKDEKRTPIIRYYYKIYEYWTASGVVVRANGYRSRDPSSIPDDTRFSE
jgi:hypothetical protein